MTRTTHRRKTWIAPALIFALALGSACGSTGRTATSQGTRLTVEEMAADLDLFTDYFESTFETAGLEMEQADNTDEERQSTHRSIRQIVDGAHQAADEPDPRLRLAYLWTHCRRIEDYLEAPGDGTADPKVRALALEAARDVNQRIERVVHSYLPPDAYAKLEQEIERRAASERIEEDAGELSFPDPTPVVTGADTTFLGSVFDSVTSPFTMFGKVGKSADTFQDLTRQVTRFNNLVEVLPQRAALQARVVLKDLDRSTTFSKAADGIDRMATAADRMTTVAEETPGRIRSEGEALLARLDDSQPELRKTIQAAQATVTSANDALGKFESMAKDMPATVEPVEKAGVAWTATAAEISRTLETYDRLFPSDPDAQPKERDPESFTFPRMTATADAWSGTVVEVRGLLSDLDTALSKNAEDGPLTGLDEGADRIAERAGSELREVVDHAALRIAQLLGLAFVLGLAFHFIARKRKA